MISFTSMRLAHTCYRLDHVILVVVAHTVTNVLGVSQACCWEECCVSNIASGNSSTGGGGVGWDRSSSKDQPQPSPTPPTQRRLAKSFSVTPSAVTKGIFSAILSLADTILNMFCRLFSLQNLKPQIL